MIGNPLVGRTGFAMLNDNASFGRVADAIHREDGMDRVRAGRVLDQVVILLHAAGHHRTLGLCPSRPVDVGWARLVTYTRIYARVCKRVAGRFVDHTPLDGLAYRQAPAVHSLLGPVETAAFLLRQGYWLDDELWTDDTRVAMAN
jgi:hypothetical protein